MEIVIWHLVMSWVMSVEAKDLWYHGYWCRCCV
jgi:hypothetical protein